MSPEKEKPVDRWDIRLFRRHHCDDDPRETCPTGNFLELLAALQAAVEAGDGRGVAQLWLESYWSRGLALAAVTMYACRI